MWPKVDGHKAISVIPILFITLVVYFSSTLIGHWSEVIFTKHTIWFLLATYAIFLSGFAVICLMLYFAYCLQYGSIHLINHIFYKNIRTRTFLEVVQLVLYLFPKVPYPGYSWVSVQTLLIVLLMCLIGLTPAMILCFVNTKKNSTTLREYRKEAYRVSTLSLVTTVVIMLCMMVLYYDVYMATNAA